MKISKKMLVVGVAMAGFAMQSSGMTVTEWCGQKSKDGGKTFYVNADITKISKSLKIEFTPAEMVGDWSQISLLHIDQGKSTYPWNGTIQGVIKEGVIIPAWQAPANSEFAQGSYKLSVDPTQWKTVTTVNPYFPNALPVDESVNYTPTSSKPIDASFTVKAYAPASIVATVTDNVNTTINPANEDDGLIGGVYAVLTVGNDIYVINPDAKTVSNYVSESQLVPVYSGKLEKNTTVKLWSAISSTERTTLKSLGAVLYVGYGVGSATTAISDMLKAEDRLPTGNVFVGNAKFVQAITAW
jgi:hypothetical protein